MKLERELVEELMAAVRAYVEATVAGAETAVRGGLFERLREALEALDERRARR